MEIKFANNASSKLLDNILEDTTSITILPGTGLLFPILLKPADYFKITLINPGDGSMEICHVTSVNGDTFTVERGKEGTIPRMFPQNSIVDNRLTAGSIEHILNDVASSTSTPGRIRIATEDEVKAGVVDDAAMVPAYSTSLYVPVGLIAPYSGQLDSDGFVIDAATSKVRRDWHVCDGTAGTPDLRSRFVRAVGSDVTLNSSGGDVEATSDITVDGTTLTTQQLAAHVHDTYAHVGAGPQAGTSHSILGWDASHRWVTANCSTSYTGGNGMHTHGAKMSPVSTVPPYYALYYIMKIS